MVHIALIILTKNEELLIEKVLRNVRRSLDELSAYKFDLYLCDDSSDQTASIAEALGCTIIKGSGRGLGFSYYKALEYFSHKDNYDILITMDGDGQVEASEFPLFLQALDSGTDMVVGSRFLGKKQIYYKYPLINYIGVKILSTIICLGARQRFTDSHGGIRVLRPSVTKGFKFLGGHSYVQETVIDARQRGFKVREIPSAWNLRTEGVSRVVHSPLTYGRKMIFPLFLRLSGHLWFGLFTLVFALFHTRLWLFAVPVVAIAEFYKRRRFVYNNRVIRGTF